MTKFAQLKEAHALLASEVEKASRRIVESISAARGDLTADEAAQLDEAIATVQAISTSVSAFALPATPEAVDQVEIIVNEDNGLPQAPEVIVPEEKGNPEDEDAEL